MRKIAVFVEGQTESIFAQELIRQLIGEKYLLIDSCKLLGGRKSPRKLVIMNISGNNDEVKYYFMIYDCGGDGRVKSDIIDRISTMEKEGFSLAIGIRDVYPNNNNIAKLRSYLLFGVPSSILDIRIVLAVNEVESWFLAEDKHYKKVDKRLTPALVSSVIGINILSCSTESIDHPSDALNDVYQQVGKAYKKTRTHVCRTVHNLDYENLYVCVRHRNNSLCELLNILDSIIIPT